MAITSERLRQTFSEGGAQEIYREIKATGGFLDFARRYVFDKDYRVARSALWGLTKATDEELSELQVTLNELIDQAMQTANSSVRRLTLNIIERLWSEVIAVCVGEGSHDGHRSSADGGKYRVLPSRRLRPRQQA